MNINKILKEASKLADRREFLCQHVPACACGEKQQIQLIHWHSGPAIWKCRICHKEWTYEPKSN